MDKVEKTPRVSAKPITLNKKYRLQHQLGEIDAPRIWSCYIYGME
jgi:hypothetical protein